MLLFLKLNGIIEMSSKSIWLSNRLVNEEANLQKLENELSEAELQGKLKFLKNITKEQIDNNKKMC